MQQEGTSRRSFMKSGAAAGVLLGTSPVGARNGSENGKAPVKNILVFFVDQQRQDCLGCYGNTIVQTPNIDRLARSGVRFTNAFTPTPVCTPARTSLQTGLFPHTHGLIMNTARCGRNGGKKEPDPDLPFFSEYMKEKGWNLAHVGKWHIGTERNKPSYHGYDDLTFYPDYGYPRRHPHYLDYLETFGLDGFSFREEICDPSKMRTYAALQRGPQEASIPAYVAGQAVDGIREYIASEKPFFVSVNFWGPHAPYDITEKHYRMYDDEIIEPWPNFDCDLSDKPGVIRRYGQTWRTGWFTKYNLPRLIGKYYGYISLIDEEIGRVTDALEQAGKLNETLVIFTADHGSSVGSYRMWDKGFSMYDCITRIPMVVSHPSIPPHVSNAFVSLLDLTPTFLDIAGCTVPEDMQGQSLMPILTGEKSAVRDDFIVTEAFGHQLPFWQRMVRTETSKYIYNPVDDDEFYDLADDPHETRNIIRESDDTLVEQHRERLVSWMKETGDPLQRWGRPIV